MDNEFDALIVVDVQPEYEDSCEHILDGVIEKIENTDKPVIFFYVGEDLFPNEDKDSVSMMLLKNGLSEEKLDKIIFIEKSYGYYRSFMDQGVSGELILDIVKKMMGDKLYDLRDIQDIGFENITEWLNSDSSHTIEVAEDLLDGGDTIYLPQFKDFYLKKLPHNAHVELIGGGRWECLEEINIHLQAQGLKTTVNENLSYGAEPINLKKKNKR